MERTKRQPVVSTAKANAKNAIEALRAAREGGARRAATFEVKDESALYDVVSEQDYAQIAAKRRADGGNDSKVQICLLLDKAISRSGAGDFIIDDDGQGYQDLGEDDYWNEREGEGDDGEGEDDGGKAGKKAKKAGGG